MARTFFPKYPRKNLRYESDERPLLPAIPEKTDRVKRKPRLSGEEFAKSRVELRETLARILKSDLPEKSFALLLSLGLVGYLAAAIHLGLPEIAMNTLLRELAPASVAAPSAALRETFEPAAPALRTDSQIGEEHTTSSEPRPL